MTQPVQIIPENFPLQSLYRWERERAQRIFMTQPMGNGVVRDITWEQCASEVRRMATWINAQGWPAGSRIAILGKNSAHWILADLAIWMTGHISVPIYPTFNGEALRYILTHSESKMCFVGKLDEVAALKTGIPSGVSLVTLPLAPSLPGTPAWDDLIAKNEPLTGTPVRDGKDLATIVYTSGTTGNPKGVMQNFQAMSWALASGATRIPVAETERLLSYLPLAHVVERILVEQGGLRYGCHVFFAESLDTFVQDIYRARPTIFFSVPRLWVKFQQGIHAKMPPAKLKRLLRIPILGGIVRKKILKGLGLDQCHVAVTGAAPMPPELLRFYIDLGLNMIEGYGMTENCAVTYATLPGSFRPGTVGLPYAGIETRIDPATGEIQLLCPDIMMGYYKDPEQTAAAIMPDGYLRTGDKGVLEADGCLRITGRVKDIFKTSKGKYVAPAPIEDLLVGNPDIEACVVTGANFAQPLAIVMLSPDAIKKADSPESRAALTASLTEHLKSVNARLEAHEKLDCLVVVSTPWTPENGLVTPTFKVKRPRIEDAYADKYEGWFAQRKPVVWF